MMQRVSFVKESDNGYYRDNWLGMCLAIFHLRAKFVITINF